MAFKSLNELPNEILHEIALQARLFDRSIKFYDTQEPPNDPWYEEYPTFKSLRLVNGGLEAAFTPIVFERIILRHLINS